MLVTIEGSPGADHPPQTGPEAAPLAMKIASSSPPLLVRELLSR